MAWKTLKSHQSKAHLALSGSGVLFGANYWIAKGLMPDFLKPLQIIFIRGLASLILFWAMAAIYRNQNVAKKDHFMLALCGLTGITINQIFFFTGLNLTSPFDTALIHSGSPVMVLLFAVWLNGERSGPARITGILLGAAGAVLIILQGNAGTRSTNPMLGNSLIFLNILSYSLYLVLIKPLLARYNTATVMKWVFLYGFLLALPFCLPLVWEIRLTILTPGAWYSLVYIVIGTTFLTYFLTTYALRTVSAGIAGYYIYLQPVIAALIGIFFFEEQLSAAKIIAALLVFAGVYLVNKKSRIRKDA